MEKYYWLNKNSRQFLERGYLDEGTTPEQRVRQIAENSEKILTKLLLEKDSDKFAGFADKLESYVANGWISFSSPVWSNFGNKKGLPCSCNGQLLEDTIESILDNAAEMGTMAKFGAGCSGYIGELRPRGTKISVGGESSGPCHFLEIYNTVASVISQSNVRRGHFAAYLNIDHPDLEEFLRIRGEGHPIQELSLGVTITNNWMNSMIEGDKEKRKIWASIIRKRFETGFPYLFFTDTINDNKHQSYKDKDIKIWASNMCTETAIPAGEDFSFVCVLSSLNLLHYEDWKDTDLIEVMTYFLDSVTEEYIEKTEGIKHLQKANKFAREHRSIGLGVLGWHSYLQKNNIPFESIDAKFKNSQIFKLINDKSLLASKDLAKLFGEPEILKGYGDRMTTRLAIAPTTSSSLILGAVSQGVEPENSCYYIKKLSKGSFTYKNPYLKEILKKYDKNDEDTWKSILIHGGSVQHLDFLSENEKEVFKTFGEISQKEIVIQQAQRQKFIDQSVSLNLMIPPKTKPKDVSDLLIFGWQQGIKTFYYQRSFSESQQLVRSINIMECKSCEA